MRNFNRAKTVVITRGTDRDYQQAIALFLKSLIFVSSLIRIGQISSLNSNFRLVFREASPSKVSHSKSKNSSKKAAKSDEIVNHFPSVGLICLICTFNDTNGGIPFLGGEMNEFLFEVLCIFIGLFALYFAATKWL